MERVGSVFLWQHERNKPKKKKVVASDEDEFDDLIDEALNE
jgi:hypothetical protein